MSTQPPPRRRRIAGERRPATEPKGLESERRPTGTAASTTVQEPVLDGREGDDAVQPPPAAPATPTDRSTPPTDSPTRKPSRSPSWWGGRPSLFALAGVLAVLATLTALLLLGLGLARPLGVEGIADLREADQTADARETAPSIAEKAAEAILAYDHRTLAADKDAAQRFMTPEFGEKYRTTFEKTVEQAAKTYQARVTSQVLGSSVVRATPEKVRVLLFVDQTTVASNRDQPRVALNRVEMSMVKRGSSWLVADIASF